MTYIVEYRNQLSNSDLKVLSHVCAMSCKTHCSYCIGSKVRYHIRCNNIHQPLKGFYFRYIKHRMGLVDNCVNPYHNIFYHRVDKSKDYDFLKTKILVSCCLLTYIWCQEKGMLVFLISVVFNHIQSYYQVNNDIIFSRKPFIHRMEFSPR